jgi:hypothetical protein
MIKCNEESRLRLPKKPDSYTSTNKYSACVEFEFENEDRHGFHTSQLIDYTLKANPDVGDDRAAPPQKLTLAFSTADVVILGWRLARLADLLRDNELSSVRELPKSYAEMDMYDTKPFASSIIIAPFVKQ